MEDRDALREVLRSPLDEQRDSRKPPWVFAIVFGLAAAVAVGAVLLIRAGGDADLVPAASSVPGGVAPTTLASVDESTTTSLVGESGVPETRAFQELATTADGTVVMFGGFVPAQFQRELAPDTWLLDPANGSWRYLAGSSGPEPKMGHSLVFHPPTDQVVLFGGGTTEARFCRRVRRCSGPEDNQTWFFDPVTGVWEDATATESAPSARFGQVMAYDPGSGLLVMFGGASISGAANSASVLDDTWTYDPATRSWDQKTPTNSPGGRVYGALVHDPTSDRMLLFSGDGEGPADDDHLWAYDVAADTWEDLGGGGPTARWSAAMSVDRASGSLIVAGGEGVQLNQISEDVSTKEIAALSDVWVYLDGAGWVEQNPFPEEIGLTTATQDAERGVLVFVHGGLARYDPSLDRWEPVYQEAP